MDMPGFRREAASARSASRLLLTILSRPTTPTPRTGHILASRRRDGFR